MKDCCCDKLTNKEAIQNIYRTADNLRAKYEVMQRYAIQQETFEKWVLHQLALIGCERVLDTGCGEGRFLLPIARPIRSKGGWVVGCDLSRGVMAPIQDASAREDLPVRLSVAQAEALPFPPRLFDLVMANHMLYHVPDIPKALREAYRVLKPRGRFLATTNSRKGMPELYALHLQTMAELGISHRAEKKDPFSLENGAPQLSEVFGNVQLLTYEAGFRVTKPEPVLSYYMATQLYQVPYNDPDTPASTRAAIASTFRRLTAEAISKAGGTLAISKPVAAFICQKDGQNCG